jgi:hypothetical protein
MKHLLLTVSLLLSGMLVHAQWYFETSVTNNQLISYKLTDSNLVASTPTSLKSIDGIRDLSLGLGYLFSFKTLEQRMAADFKIPFVCLGLGLGFEQFTLRTNAIINNVTYPNVYAMAQAQGCLGVHLTPLTLYAKRTDDMGNKKPLFLVDVHGGISYNYYTYRNAAIPKQAHFDKLSEQSEDTEDTEDIEPLSTSSRDSRNARNARLVQQIGSFLFGDS